MVAICLIASVVLIAWYARLAVAAAGSPSAERLLLGLIAAIAVPYGAALLVLALAPRARGLALAGGTALVALVPIAPFVGVTLLFIGFSTTREQVTSVLVSVGFVLVQVLLLGAAIVAHRGLAERERLGGAWAIGIAAPMLYAFLWLGVARGTTIMTEGRQRGSHEGEQAARLAIRRLRVCLARHADAHPDRGFPATLADLGASEPACAPSALADAANGYRFTYVSGVADAAGVVRLFSLCAEPLRYARTGYTTFVVDESGAGAEAYPTSGRDEAALGCADAWRQQAGLLGAIKHCLLRHAAGAPTHGYPPTLDALVTDGCVVLEHTRVAEDGRSSFWEHDTLYSYEPGAAGDDRRIRSFDLRATSQGGRARLVDETGAVHEAEDRPATRADPAPEVGDTRRCREDGDASACLALAWKYEVGHEVRLDPVGALDLYERACERGNVQGCLSGGWLFERAPELTADPRRKAALFARACALGDANGCEHQRPVTAGTNATR